MRPETLDAYVKAADLGVYRTAGAKPTVQTSPVLSPDTVRRLGPTLLIGRYKPTWQDERIFVTRPDGWEVWMMPTMYRVYLAVMAELDAGRDLSSTVIARISGASQGYVSKVIHWLERFRFITILGVFRGRWGRVVAKVRSIIPPSRKVVEYLGGMITVTDADMARWEAEHDLMVKPWTTEELDF